MYQEHLVAKLINVQPFIDDIIKKRRKLPGYIKGINSNVINSKKLVKKIIKQNINEKTK